VTGGRSSTNKHRGMALVAVLWIVAALSILVTGMVQAQRDEIRLVSAARQTAQGGAIGSAAIQMVLQDLTARALPVSRLLRIEVRYAGLAIPVEVIPLNGFVDINRAQPALLASLLTVAGGQNADRANSLAQAIVAARVPRAGTPVGPRFEAIEDLLQVPGIDFSLYARLSRFITTDTMGSGRINPMAAPEGVLVVLSDGDSGRAARIAAGRDSGEAGVDTTGLPAQYVESAPATRFRLVARVPLSDGRRLVSSRMVETGRTAPDGVPWRIFQAEDQFEPAPAIVN
jgi:general secretion pathway protein K